MASYLDYTGLGLYHSKIKNEIDKKLSVKNLGDSFIVNPTTGKVQIDPDKVQAGSVSWENITNKPDLTNAYTYKGTVNDIASLPTTDNKAGDTYYVTGEDKNYVWNGTEWEAMTGNFAIDSITNEQIDALFAEETGE